MSKEKIDMASLTFARNLGEATVEEYFCTGRQKNLAMFVERCEKNNWTIYSEGGWYNSYDNQTVDIVFHPWLIAITGEKLPQTFKASTKGLWWIGVFAKVKSVEDSYLHLDVKDDANFLADEAIVMGCCY